MELKVTHAVLIIFGMALSLMTLSVAFADTKTSSQPVPSLDFARGLIEAERYQQAVDVLKQLDDGSDTNSAQISLLFGRIYLSIGKPAKALDFFEQAAYTSLDAEAESYLGLAEAQLALGDLSKARKNAGLALRSDPDLVAAHLVLARVDQRAGRGDQAMARLRQLQHDRPSSEDVVLIIAGYLAQQDSTISGAGELHRFVDQHPNAAQAWDALGQMEWVLGHKDIAIDAKATAQRLYKDRGQLGRAELIALWLKNIGPQELPSVQVEPRPIVESDPLLPQKITRSVAMSHPEPLPFTPGTPVMTGSGVVLEGGRQIITNRHVIEGMHTIAVRNGTGHVRNAHVVRTSTEDDLALLEIDTPFPDAAVMPLAEIAEPPTGREAVVMGFPMISVFGDEQPALTEGIVAKTTGLANDPNTFQMTAKINKGNSGGPIFDKRGHLIGVAVGKVDAADIYQKNGIRIEDINIGIKGGRILRFLGKPVGQETSPAEMTLEDIYQQMLPRTVLVAAQR